MNKKCLKFSMIRRNLENALRYVKGQQAWRKYPFNTYPMKLIIEPLWLKAFVYKGCRLLFLPMELWLAIDAQLKTDFKAKYQLKLPLYLLTGFRCIDMLLIDQDLQPYNF
jgi:hypothetical protein